MAKLQLSLIISANARTQPILNGSVQPDGIDLAATSGTPGEIFWRQLHHAEFDVSEMSLSSLLIVTAQGSSPWVGLPIFPIRRFFHAEMLVRADAGIERPEDLRGKRIGVPEYQQTAALWVRGALRHEFGVGEEELDWYMERTEELSHGGATGFRPPPGVSFQYIPRDKSIASMLVAGELDATAFYVTHRNMLDRSGVDLQGHPRIRSLFPDPIAEGARYSQQTGIARLNHAVVVRRSILERHPWVALNLYKAFLAAKDGVAARARELAEPYFRLGLLPAEAHAGLDADPYPYGVQANRHVLETVTAYSHEQGLTPRRVQLDEVFAPSTLDL